MAITIQINQETVKGSYEKNVKVGVQPGRKLLVLDQCMEGLQYNNVDIHGALYPVENIVKGGGVV